MKKEIKNIFTEIYNNNSWKCDESKSGPGSKLSTNKKLLFLLQNFVKENNIKRIIDCGCGDFNWMKTFNFDLIDSYVGIDIVEPLISENIKKYQTDKIKFECKSIVDDLLPDSDLIICKDVLFHLSFDDALSSLSNFNKTKCNYLLSTNFTNFKNRDIKSGDWRPINLMSKPFNVGEPISYWDNIEERSDHLSNKSIGIWKIG